MEEVILLKATLVCQPRFRRNTLIRIIRQWLNTFKEWNKMEPKIFANIK